MLLSDMQVIVGSVCQKGTKERHPFVLVISEKLLQDSAKIRELIEDQEDWLDPDMRTLRWCCMTGLSKEGTFVVPSAHDY